MIACGTPSSCASVRTWLFKQVADRQHVHAAVSVLREVADRQLAAVAGAGDEVARASWRVIERRHPQPWPHVAEARHASAASSPRGRICDGSSSEPDARFVTRAHRNAAVEIDRTGRDVERICDEGGVGLVAADRSGTA